MQVVPNLPWTYSGWIPVLLSLAAWLFLLLAILTSGAFDAAMVVPLFLLWMVAFTLPLSFWGGGGASFEHKTEQVSEWQLKKAEGERVLASFQCDRDRLIKHLGRLGVKSSSDLSKVPAARPVAKELAEVVKQIDIVEETNLRLGAAVADIESNLRRVGRRNIIGKVGLSGEEEKDLARRGLELEDKMGKVSPLDVEEIVDGVLSE